DIDFFKLIQGAVVVAREGKKIAEISQPGEYFGEMSAITGEVRSASIVSKGRSMVKRFPGDKLSEIILKYPEVSGHLFKTLASRLSQANAIMVKLAADLSKKS
ncbi:MAG: cyclic nucleotide-binding domain-containing protein, partial [Desulfobulbaceae bacterium]|nr:cyclic nucleotide-binding domain-containing protein [Desulfobulbaceae bacterium]